MKSQTVVVVCVLTTIIFGTKCLHVAAFATSPAGSTASVGTSDAVNSMSHSTHQRQLQNARNNVDSDAAAAAAAVEFMAAFPVAGAYLNSPTGGGMSVQPHGSDEAIERAVYDPGDDLLRTLNAEFAANGQELGILPEEPDYADTVFNEFEAASKFDMLRKLEKDLHDEQEIVSKSALLMKLLEDPSIETLPVVYVEESAIDENNSALYPSTTGLSKRSRYYRRYPWKRHNRNRSNYEPELRYACTPTKEDVFKLLVNLHENRKGNHSKTVNFCNRKRPAKAIFTNIRFLG